MAGFNGNGPTGLGPMTGRGRGLCITDEPEQVRRLLGLQTDVGLGRDGDDSVGGRAQRVGRDRRSGWSR